MRRATGWIFFPHLGQQFQSTLSLRRATDYFQFPSFHRWISIHALLAESDQRTLPLPPSPPQISIHALLAESDPFPREECPSPPYFNPRSPCGERPVSTRECPSPPYFNPRSPCGERPEAAIKDALNITFQSTLSLRRATGEVLQRLPFGFISIHALLAESDRRSQRDPPLP